jgi:hypothetical protein
MFGSLKSVSLMLQRGVSKKASKRKLSYGKTYPGKMIAAWSRTTVAILSAVSPQSGACLFAGSLVAVGVVVGVAVGVSAVGVPVGVAVGMRGFILTLMIKSERCYSKQLLILTKLGGGEVKFSFWELFVNPIIIC